MSSASRALVLLIEERSQASRFSFYLLARSLARPRSTFPEPAHGSGTRADAVAYSRCVRTSLPSQVPQPTLHPEVSHCQTIPHRYRLPARYSQANHRAPPQQVGNTPLADRLAQDPSAPPQQQQPQQQPPAPTPQQTAVAAKHHATREGRTLPFRRFGHPDTGEPIKQKPGAIFRSLLAGAMLGSSYRL